MTKRRRGTLAIWMNGERVGTWSVSRGGFHGFAYAPSWLESPNTRPLSLSLPFTAANSELRGRVVESFFENLLPDSEPIRRRIAARFGVASTAAWELLAEIGRDCVGAVQILSEADSPADPSSLDGAPLTSSEIERRLLGVTSPPRFVSREKSDENFRISLAGAQEKTAFLLNAGRWCLPRGATPTTHIFKLPLGRVGARALDMTLSLENEWLCAQILGQFGLRVAEAELSTFGDVRTLIVTRFDRARSTRGPGLLRLPQEDFCQALGVPPDRKYESEGGPGIEQILSVLEGSSARVEDRRDFFRAQVLFWLLAAIDGHAKNFSIHLQAGGSYRATPLYDVISAYPIAGRGPGQLPFRKLRLAMSVRGSRRHYRITSIRRAHWVRLAQTVRLEADPEELLNDIARSAPKVVSTVARKLPRGFPAKVADAILDGLLRAVKAL